jgi:DNA polymerase-3 subunit alpha
MTTTPTECTDNPTPRQRGPRPISSLIADPPPAGAIVVLAGLISALERRVNPDGEPWAIVTLHDLGASIRVLFAPAYYTSWAVDLVEGAPVVITGRAGRYEGTVAVSEPTVRVAAPPDVEDLTARLAAADLVWSMRHGDPPAEPDYIRCLARQVCT